MPFMYILKCADQSFYTGSTWDLVHRIAQHKSGEGSRYTSKRVPVKLVYYEEFDSIKQAFLREKQVQGWGRKKKEALIKGFNKKLKPLSECQNESHCDNVHFDKGCTSQTKKK